MPYKEVFDAALHTENAYTDKNGIGNVDHDYKGNKFRWVANTVTNVDLSLGHVVFHKLSDGADMYKYVYKAATADLSIMAGVVVSTNGIKSSTGTNPSRYGWIQCAGYCASVSVSGETTGGTDIAAGDYLKGVNAQTYAARDGATQPLYIRNIQILEAVATTTTPAAAAVKGWINCG